MARKKAKSEAPKKIKPISLNILEIAKRLQKLEQTSGGGDHSALANKSDIATEFSTTTAYTAGCFVYHDGKLYQFNADHSAGAWDPTDVVLANVTDQVVSNKAAIDGLTASDVTYGSGTVEDALDGLTDYSSDTLSNTTYLYADATITKRGNVVMIRWNGLKGLTNQTTQTLSGLIPKKYRPLSEINFDLCPPSTASVLDIYRIKIKTNGDVTVYPYNGVSAQNNLLTTITYLI